MKFLCSILFLLIGLNAFAGTDPSNTFTLGDATSATHKQFRVNTGTANKPQIRWNQSSAKWEFSDDGSVFNEIGTAGGTEGFDASSQISNLGIASSVGSNALTISLKGKDGNDPGALNVVRVSFRNSTATTGTYEEVERTSALSVVVSSGSTLGTLSALESFVYVYALNNAGTMELAVAGSRLADEGKLYSTTAEGGAGAADSSTVLYSTTARSNVAVRLIGRVRSTQATAGTWATTPSENSITPFGLNNVAITQADGGSKVASFVVAGAADDNATPCTATCTIYRSTLAGITASQTGGGGSAIYSITLPSFFTQKPVCNISAGDTAIRLYVHAPISATSLTVRTYNTGDTLDPAIFNVRCEGI